MKVERELQLIVEELEHVRKYNNIIKDFKNRVNVLASELAVQVRENNIDDQEREDKFNDAWVKWLTQFPTRSKYNAGFVDVC
jgi:hypothetical protein